MIPRLEYLKYMHGQNFHSYFFCKLNYNNKTKHKFQLSLQILGNINYKCISYFIDLLADYLFEHFGILMYKETLVANSSFFGS
jgi:hypothetical protein